MRPVFMCSWARHLVDEMLGRGFCVEYRRSRSGSTVWRFNGEGRWIPTGPALRKMEIAIYGRPNP